ncbi:helix-turn-helix domain-containing protein [Streptomyces mobaraensis NBRC 13819 = DSM 40847]|uniref:Putative AraC family transcriptional regulator n=1 Tax=Streptomyces mobaraensis (strain ATCC 29032 / DSM 40847 / JCM 4168 / NBRC 13819 / NCIMB 11159 / IPCR 16-22) TaxID=1223523 RepID=M3C925_STRM1|nr:helix-turn-helix domain-containing protein [Streptomyces mobaraensis]EMF00451.1 putative AraC family transcriptional regulator [Streptomyces mobaraensis NBRC 13819 = DSM 40847]QTT73251.1 helix-turn-helix domain-containing protein [Streptomyces mobaraensis NBRC 13819 = DSM 40847]
MHHVGVLALDGVVPFELGIPGRVLGAARGAAGEPLYSVATCSVDGGPVRTEADYGLTVAHDASLLARVDTVVIPPSHDLGPVREEGRLPDPLRAALAAIRPGTRVVGICTAAYVLAAAGLLDHRPATTHWREADRLRRMFTTVRVEPDVLFVDDGDVLTSAGVAAGIDLCLHLVRRDHGSRIANEVARSCVVPPWREGGQAQYIRRPVPEPAATGTAPARAWAVEHLAEPLTLADLATRANMSVRTFTRRFRDETGATPGQWLTLQRVELARHLLETTDWPVDVVAHRAGFGTGVSLRRHLHAAVGVTPQAYRRTFRPPGAGTAASAWASVAERPRRGRVPATAPGTPTG